ncbi:MAG TPA: prepilin peptidase [Anaeromyxobacter sp.]|nr:prepilin peptidase [Anaeromyxobacter sp.]
MEELVAALPAPLVVAWVAILGGVLGSFLNVVISRVPVGESVVHPGSRCPACRTPIRWYDNVPVASWLILRARCRACGARISVRYPAVELAGVAAALLALWHRGFGLAGLAELILSTLLLALSAIDLDTWLLPNVLTWPLLALGLGASAAGLSAAPSLASSALGAALGFGAFALVAWVGKKLAGREALGFGDVWLLAGLGAWMGAAALLPLVLLASLQGAVVGIALLLVGKAQTGEPRPARAQGGGGGEDDWVPPRNAVPFGPFLALGALEWLYLGDAIIRLLPSLEVFR